MERIRHSVTPSGISFSVRNLIGSDQNLLSEAQDGSGDTTSFDKMLAGALRSIGDKTESEITPNVVKQLLSNDRKFILVTIREHSLGYKKVFSFNFEWPLRQGSKDKEIIPYEVNLSPENFPIIPYYWVAEHIEALSKQASEKKEELIKPDGHNVLFPVMYESYSSMLAERKYVTGQFESGVKYRWQLLDGETESKFAKTKMVINTILDMRRPQINLAGDIWSMYDTGRADILELEHLRKERMDKEGNVDTLLTIQHPDNVRSQKVDLVSLPVFFFPSQAL